MQLYCNSLTAYSRLKTKEVKTGNLLLGNLHPVRIQTMTTADTMNTIATVEQTIRCIEAGAELVRITAPSIKEAENLRNIKNQLHQQGYYTPLIADIHFTPNAAEVAARIVEKVRINPGNYVDKKKFQQIEYTHAEYNEEIDHIRERFTPLIKICKDYGTAMRIGTNHGSLSDRIMSRYGDTPMGMVESAMEFLRICRGENFHNIVLSMKSSNPQVMVHAYRLLINKMFEEFNECYALHLGVTEAGDGEDGRIKSAIGIGTLMEDGIGDTIRVSLTEDPEFEIPVCKNIVKRYSSCTTQCGDSVPSIDDKIIIKSFPSLGGIRGSGSQTVAVENIGGNHVPVVIANLIHLKEITPASLKSIGYTYHTATAQWNIADAAADFIFINQQKIKFALPGHLKVIAPYYEWLKTEDKKNIFPVFSVEEFIRSKNIHPKLNFVKLDCFSNGEDFSELKALIKSPAFGEAAVLCLSSRNKNAMQSVRRMCIELQQHNIKHPVIIFVNSNAPTGGEHLIHFATEAGALLLDGFGDGICLGIDTDNENSEEQFLNNTAFSILQATRTRISKTDYISCPGCGRTLFNLQETTEKIRSVTHHLKGIKIAVMGCIVNGPGEMADADFGYVGSGSGKITLYKGKEIVKRNINSNIAVDELINLLKESGAWVDIK